MIATALIDEIRNLLRTGRLSQRKIARRIGVSRGTVNAIARGRRPNNPARRKQVAPGFAPPDGMPERCPGCGGMVQMPCLFCHLRAVTRGKRGAGVC